jgi:hypothetical protein
MELFRIHLTNGNRKAWTVLSATNYEFACMHADAHFAGSGWQVIR